MGQTDELATIWTALRKAVPHLPQPVRNRAENAFEGFKRARILLPIDREIASFRAITAEEEGAAALIRSLQLRGYPSAEKIDLRLHQHKAAVGFFLATVRQTIASQTPVTLRLSLRIDPPALTVALPLSQFIETEGEDFQIVMAQPLGGIATAPGVAEEDFFDRAVAKVSGG